MSDDSVDELTEHIALRIAHADDPVAEIVEYIRQVQQTWYDYGYEDALDEVQGGPPDRPVEDVVITL